MTEVFEDGAPVSAAQSTPNYPAFSQDLLRMYYDRLFPYQLFCRWLSYKNDPKNLVSPTRDLLHRREFSFTLPGDIYCRYQCFPDAEELRKRLMEAQPEKIDIGAVFNIQPALHNTVDPRAFFPVERELVFDIDMDDYDSIRTCCVGAKLCRKCWQFMACAIKVLDLSLREDFGFEHVLFVFSGRRGVHVWVSDEAARKLPNDKRSGVAEYLSLIAGTAGANRTKVDMPGFTTEFHPMVARAIEVGRQTLEKNGLGILDGQEPFRNENIRERFFTLFGAEDHDELLKFVSTPRTSREVWAKMKLLMKDSKAKRTKAGLPVSPHLIEQIIVELTYPRLDINVSKSMNHLLKSPFCVHPKTGKVCVPIDVANLEKFDVANVPTLGLLNHQVNLAGDARVQTALYEYVKFFEHKFLVPLEGSIVQQRQKRDLSF